MFNLQTQPLGIFEASLPSLPISNDTNSPTGHQHGLIVIRKSQLIKNAIKQHLRGPNLSKVVHPLAFTERDVGELHTKEKIPKKHPMHGMQ